MTTFKTDLIATADNKGEFNIPDELLDEYIMDRAGWDYFTLRNTPEPTIERLLFLWQLYDTAQKANDRKATPPKGKSGK